MLLLSNIIHNGVLGQTSHHNVHSHCNHNIIIENVHGIQLNGFDGIVLDNVRG